MQRAVEIYAIINLAVVGVSHILRPRVWVEFFALLLQRGKPGVFAAAMLNLIFGSIIVAFHNVWSGIPLVLTLLGWASVVKAAIYFAFPEVALRKLAGPIPQRPSSYVVAGIVCLLLAALLAYHVCWASRESP